VGTIPEKRILHLGDIMNGEIMDYWKKWFEGINKGREDHNIPQCQFFTRKYVYEGIGPITIKSPGEIPLTTNENGLKCHRCVIEIPDEYLEEFKDPGIRFEVTDPGFIEVKEEEEIT
jgi:hypothetical protein